MTTSLGTLLLKRDVHAMATIQVHGVVAFCHFHWSQVAPMRHRVIASFPYGKQHPVEARIALGTMKSVSWVHPQSCVSS